MKNKIIFFLFLTLFNIYLFNSFRSEVQSQDITDEPTPTVETPTDTPTETPAEEPTASPTDIPTETPVPTDEPTPTVTPTSFSTPSPTVFHPSATPNPNSNNNQPSPTKSPTTSQKTLPTIKITMFPTITDRKEATAEAGIILGANKPNPEPTQIGKLLGFQIKIFPFLGVFLFLILAIMNIHVLIILVRRLLPLTRRFIPYCYKKAPY